MSLLDRLYPWPHGLLPRRSAAARNTPRQAAQAALVAIHPAAAPAAESERQALTERRSQALRTMFPMLFSMVARRSDLWQAIAIERYLSQASNLTELEQRIQEVQRRRGFSWSE